MSNTGQLDKAYYVKNKDQRRTWNMAYLLGLTQDKPLPKSRQEAVYNFIENGHLDYLPDDSEVTLNALSDGGGDITGMPVRIPNNWEDKSPDDPVRARVQAYIAAKDSGQFPYSAEPIHPLPTQTPASNAPIYLGQWGPVTVLNPAPAYASAIHQPSSHTEPPAVGSAPGPAAASKDNKLKGKQKEKLNEKGAKEFEYQFMLNTMDPKKENETVYLPDSKSQSAQEVLDEILGRMKVELSVHQIGYRLSDEKECIFTRIHDVKDFARAIE
ncbi:uncharacterized protein EI90DRAFT_3003519, partial [Cantharellus anzutake]|uniref:uncharacterized protein n=1 Tax=Cantharellus anzutake TaxID=1750568 RepID=UPI001906D83B